MTLKPRWHPTNTSLHPQERKIVTLSIAPEKFREFQHSSQE
jgi:hypothetical protein